MWYVQLSDAMAMQTAVCNLLFDFEVSMKREEESGEDDGEREEEASEEDDVEGNDQHPTIHRVLHRMEAIDARECCHRDQDFPCHRPG